ncbi:MAG: ATP-binding protein [Ghiorsea sp.]
MSDPSIPDARQNLSNIIDSGYVFMGTDSLIFEVNAVFEKMLGYVAKELEGTSFFDLWVDPQHGGALLKQLQSASPLHGFGVEMNHKDGGVVLATINAQMMTGTQGETAGITCVISHTSDSAQQDFNQTLQNMSGNIAHLINNQMATVVGTADLMKKSLKSEPHLADKLDRITHSGLQASEVAHDLLDYTNTDGTDGWHSICLYDLATEIMNQYMLEVFNKKPRRFSFRVEKGAPTFMGKEKHIARLIRYLLDNAIEATEDGGVIILSTKIEALKNKLSGQNEPHLVLMVEDHGHGMDAQTQKRIFEPFFSTRFMGRGMSLAHVLKTIKAHHGHMHVKTGVERGSVFKVYFPLPAS